MKAAVLYNLGESPRFEQFPDPIPGEGEVLVHVRAAALKPVDRQMASGAHYASFRALPAICGADGLGYLDDGSRVLFAQPRRPYGAMAERTIVPRSFCFPVPEELDDVTAAALLNPGMSAWMSLAWRAKLAPGENVLIIGATGVTGTLAVQIARILGAGRVVAAGRNRESLESLRDLGADAIIQIDEPGGDLAGAFAREAGEEGFQVVIDYLWGAPTEAFLAAITRADFEGAATETRFVQVGESAGATISLPAAALRSAALTMMGSPGGGIRREAAIDSFRQVMGHAASGELRIDTEPVPLAGIEEAWGRQNRGGRRVVVVP